jgi:hypothetical protein
MFEHGIETVRVEDDGVQILMSESHMHSNSKKKMPK